LLLIFVPNGLDFVPQVAQHVLYFADPIARSLWLRAETALAKLRHRIKCPMIIGSFSCYAPLALVAKHLLPHGARLLGCALFSKEHQQDCEEARRGRGEEPEPRDEVLSALL
jgi:hypothetical protein